MPNWKTKMFFKIILIALLTLILPLAVHAELTTAAQHRVKKSCMVDFGRRIFPGIKNRKLQELQYSEPICNCIVKAILEDQSNPVRTKMSESDWFQFAELLEKGKGNLNDIHGSSPEASQAIVMLGGFFWVALQTDPAKSCIEQKLGAGNWPPS